MKFRMFMLLLAVLSLSGCLRQDFIVGKVIHKSYQPESYVDSYVMMHGKRTKVRTIDYEDYRLLVTPTGGGWDSDIWYITKEDYEKIEIGDEVNFYYLRIFGSGATKHDTDLQVRFDQNGKPQDWGEPIYKDEH